MKYKLALAIISTLIISSTNAQVSFGIRSGVNFSKWQGDDLQFVENIIDKTDGYVTTKGTKGMHIGGYVTIPIVGGVSIEPGLQYSKKGYAMFGDLKIDALKILGLNVGAQVQSHYIDIPLLIRVDVAKGINVFAGPQLSYLVRSSLNAKAAILGINLFNKGIGITDQFNRVDMGLSGGVGYALNKGLNVQAGYDLGLSKLNKGDSYKAHNSVIKVSVGYTF